MDTPGRYWPGVFLEGMACAEHWGVYAQPRSLQKFEISGISTISPWYAL